MTVSQRGTPAMAAAAPSNSMSVQGSWGGASRVALDLLVAVVTAFGPATTVMGAAPAGWVQVEDTWTLADGADVLGVYIAVAAGGDTAPTFTCTTTGTAADSSLQVVLYDLYDSSGGTPQVIAGGSNSGTSGTILAATGGNVPAAGCFAIAGSIYSDGTTALGTTTWTTPSGWTLSADQLTAGPVTSRMAAYHYASPPSGSALSCLFTYSGTSTAQTAAVIVAQPPATGTLAVTAQQSGTGAQNGLALAVRVVTGAAASPAGTTASQAATTPSASMTPAATGSWIYGAAENNAAISVWTPQISTQFIQNISSTFNGVAYGTFRTAAVTTAGTPVTVGATNTGITAGAFAAVEIKTSGTLAEDSSTPPVTDARSSRNLQTLAFTPPPGALLVAMVSSDGNSTGGDIVSVTVSDTSGLTWTQQAHYNAATEGYAGVWTAWVASNISAAGGSYQTFTR